MPLIAAGQVIEPSVSVPIAAGTMPAPNFTRLIADVQRHPVRQPLQEVLRRDPGVEVAREPVQRGEHRGQHLVQRHQEPLREPVLQVHGGQSLGQRVRCRHRVTRTWGP